MQINDFLQINDWKFNKFLKLILALQIAIVGIVSLDLIGLQIPVLRQFIPFLYLTFVPGFLILRILKIHNVGKTETILYSIGLSIFSLMFIGLFMDIFYPSLGISKPISFIPLLATISVFVLILIPVSYLRDRNYNNPNYINIKTILSPQFLFLSFIPFLAIFGTYIMNLYENNIVLMLLIIMISAIVLLIGFNRFIQKELYPLAVFIISISLLYHGWLISSYIWGTDIHAEYFFSNLVMINSYWDFTLPSYYNGMLSICMIAPIYSIILKLDLTWVFKVIYPFLFSMVPLGLYVAFKKQTNEKIAFLSSFFFMSAFFYQVWLIPLKQQIAELFLVLLIILIVSKSLNTFKKSVLVVIFSISLVVSHYGTSYIYMFILISAFLIMYFVNKIKANEFVSRFNINLFNNFNSMDINVNSIAKSTVILLFVVCVFAWYIYTSSSWNFIKIVQIGNQIFGSISTEFMSPEAANGLHILQGTPQSVLGYINKYLYLITEFLMSIGLLAAILKGFIKMKNEYIAFSIVAFIICLLSIGLPNFSSAIYTPRLYQITLIFLSPFCIIGGIVFLTILNKFIKTKWMHSLKENSLKILSIFLVIFLLFNIGFIDELVHTDRLPNESIPLTHYRLNSYDFNVFEQDYFGVKWLSNDTAKKSLVIYSDVISANPLTSYGGFNWVDSWNQVLNFNSMTKLDKGDYAYFSYQNIVNNLILDPNYNELNMTNMSFINNASEIYSNGGNEIYFNARNPD